jgi:hypothetical protein
MIAGRVIAEALPSGVVRRRPVPDVDMLERHFREALAAVAHEIGRTGDGHEWLLDLASATNDCPDLIAVARDLQRREAAGVEPGGAWEVTD